MRVTLPTFIAATVLVQTAHASSGDRALEFVQCLATCKEARCGSGAVYAPPLALRLTRWTCLDNCKYDCMHQITDVQLRGGQPIHQYHGKWPFWRLVGMQEPASVAFSLLNIWAHLRGAAQVRRRVSDTHPMKNYYLMWSLVSVNAWVWSSVFHTRDLPLTEKLDYFSAALAIMYALYYTTIRLFHLYPHPTTARLTSSERPPKSPIFKNILATTCTLAFIGHVTYLSVLPRFDYTYNMAFNLVLGLTHNALWTLYSLPASMTVLRRFRSHPKSYRPKFVGKAGVFVLLTTAATALELLDFPPWRGVIDAHSLWHLATAPIAFFWYDFLVQDSQDPSWRVDRI